MMVEIILFIEQLGDKSVGFSHNIGQKRQRENMRRELQIEELVYED